MSTEGLDPGRFDEDVNRPGAGVRQPSLDRGAKVRLATGCRRTGEGVARSHGSVSVSC